MQGTAILRHCAGATTEGDGRVTSITKLYGEEEIAARVAALAQEVAAALPQDFLMVGLLKGSFVFVADLIRALDRLGCRPRVEFMRPSSYGGGKQSSGEVHLIAQHLGRVDMPPEVAVESDFVGFTIPDLFVVGYGIDYSEGYRHLSYIGTVD